MTSSHKYSDDEVALILRKAADLQVQGAARAEGLTLEAIQEIAGEVGIRPEVVAEAAAIVARGTTDFGTAPTSSDKFRLELFQPGAATDEQLAELPSVIRRVMEHQGRISDVLGSIEWSTVGEPSQVAAVIRKTDNGTRVEIVADRGVAGVLTALPTMLGGFLLGAIGQAALDPGVAGTIAIMGTGFATGAVAAVSIWRHNTARFKQKMLRLAAALREALRPEQS